jgi:hypothetical protein
MVRRPFCGAQPHCCVDGECVHAEAFRIVGSIMSRASVTLPVDIRACWISAVNDGHQPQAQVPRGFLTRRHRRPVTRTRSARMSMTVQCGSLGATALRYDSYLATVPCSRCLGLHLFVGGEGTCAAPVVFERSRPGRRRCGRLVHRGRSYLRIPRWCLGRARNRCQSKAPAMHVTGERIHVGEFLAGGEGSEVPATDAAGQQSVTKADNTLTSLRFC